MFKQNNKVETGRVRAHETAESASLKVHEIIDRMAEHGETGAERAHVLRAAATEQAAATRESAAAHAAELRAQAHEARKQAVKDAQKGKKAARKRGKKAGKEVHDLRDTLVDDVLPKVTATATTLAAAGVAAGRKAADEAATRAPEVVAALRDEQDPRMALAAAKGERPRTKRRGLKFLLLALVAGGIAAFVAKQKQAPKKDPWAVPAGDPYKAPTTGRESTVAAPAAAPLAEKSDSAPAPASDPLAAPTALDQDPLAAPAAPVDDTPEARAQSADADAAEGSDAWSSARDWADNSSIPSVSGTSEGTDLSTEHLGGDLPAEGDTKA
ncbi:hypothetical protein [Janibacter terrae]|uniref:hypothetical protein n=1 Tax=Janibacter terrae TaxID=103817 RepID=UPI0037F70E1A